MAYRELSMIEVREVVRRYVSGAGLRATQIAGVALPQPPRRISWASEDQLWP